MKRFILRVPHLSRQPLAVAVLLLLSMSSSQALNVYKSIGAFGEVKYSQHRPTNGKNVEVIKLRSDRRLSNPSQLPNNSDEQANAAVTPAEQQLAALESRLKDQQTQINKQRCQSLRKTLNDLSIGGKMYEMDDDGNRNFLDDREIELKRQRTQAAIKQYCNGSTT